MAPTCCTRVACKSHGAGTHKKTSLTPGFSKQGSKYLSRGLNRNAPGRVSSRGYQRGCSALPSNLVHHNDSLGRLNTVKGFEGEDHRLDTLLTMTTIPTPGPRDCDHDNYRTTAMLMACRLVPSLSFTQ